MGPKSTIEPMEWASGRASLAPLSFDDLDGFRGDDHLAAFAAWRRSAHALLEGPAPPRPAIVAPPALIGVARAALAHDVSSRKTAADFFVSHFRPYRVFPDGEARRGFVTGYYEPALKGAVAPSPEFSAPVVARPTDLVTFSPGQPLGCWKNWNLKSSIRSAPRCGPPK